MDVIATKPFDPQVVPPAGLDLIDVHLPAYDVALTEHLVVDADPAIVFAAARDFDFLTTDAPLVTALMTARALPGLLRRRPTAAPKTLMLVPSSPTSCGPSYARSGPTSTTVTSSASRTRTRTGWERRSRRRGGAGTQAARPVTRSLSSPGRVTAAASDHLRPFGPQVGQFRPDA
jgi:hypothetical protein